MSDEACLTHSAPESERCIDIIFSLTSKVRLSISCRRQLFPKLGLQAWTSPTSESKHKHLHPPYLYNNRQEKKNADSHHKLLTIAFIALSTWTLTSPIHWGCIMEKWSHPSLYCPILTNDPRLSSNHSSRPFSVMSHMLHLQPTLERPGQYWCPEGTSRL